MLDDYSRYIIAWKLCNTMRAEDVTDTLDLALAASGCDQANVLHKPRLLSDNGPFLARRNVRQRINGKAGKTCGKTRHVKRITTWED